MPEDLRLDGNFSPEKLEINIELKWLGRDKNRDQTPLLDQILRAFRDVEDPPIKATTVNGDVIEGNELRLRRKVSVECSSRIPLSGSVYEQMAKYLAELLEKGDILPQ